LSAAPDAERPYARRVDVNPRFAIAHMTGARAVGATRARVVANMVVVQKKEQLDPLRTFQAFEMRITGYQQL